MEKGEKKKKKKPPAWLGPKDLPRSRLSNFLEAGLTKFIDDIYADPTLLEPYTGSSRTYVSDNFVKPPGDESGGGGDDQAGEDSTAAEGSDNEDGSGSNGGEENGRGERTVSDTEVAVGAAAMEDGAGDEGIKSRRSRGECQRRGGGGRSGEEAAAAGDAKAEAQEMAQGEAEETTSRASARMRERALVAPPESPTSPDEVSSSSSSSLPSKKSSKKSKGGKGGGASFSGDQGNATFSNYFELEPDEKPELTIRVVCDSEKNLTVNDAFLKRYQSNSGLLPAGFPSELPYRSKCIVLFQKVHGVDVIIFVMFVYECGDDCPEPNRNRAYISYLDSVNYFRPKRMRTAVYHEILVLYLDFIRCRGFRSAHIWACPPLKGDDYVLFCHPEDQKIPREERLCQWYMDMLDKAEARGVVSKVSNIVDEFMEPVGKKLVTDIPFFEGDYWAGEIEAIIEDVCKDEKVPWKPPAPTVPTGGLIGRKMATMSTAAAPARSMRSKQAADKDSSGGKSAVRCQESVRSSFCPSSSRLCSPLLLELPGGGPRDGALAGDLRPHEKILPRRLPRAAAEHTRAVVGRREQQQQQQQQQRWW